MIQPDTQEEITTIRESSPEQVIKTTTHVAPVVKGEEPQKAFEKKKTIFRINQVVWYILGVIEVLLVFRIFLKMLGANPDSGFASLIYALSDPLALPFNGIFGVTVTHQSVFEWSSIIAGIVYLLVAYGIVELIQLVRPTTPEEVEASV